MGLTDLFKSFLKNEKSDIFARFELLRAGISGTMSKFYMARDRKTGAIVGLKVLDKKQVAALTVRLKGAKKPSEGEIATQLVHPNIVTTLEYGTTSKQEHYLVMEYVPGPGMNSLIIGQNKLLNGKRLNLMQQCAEALSAVHSAGYIHRDICPRNLMVSADASNLKLIDFGLTVPATPEFMRPGNRTGTPAYMAPEVVRRKPTDKRLDIFSYGVTCYELFAFQLPWQGGTNGRAALAHSSEAPTPIQEYCPGIAPGLASIIMKCLQPEPTERPKTMEDVLSALNLVDNEQECE